MKRIHGLPILLVLLPLGFLAPHAAALGPSSAGLPDLDATKDPLVEDSALRLEAATDANTSVSGRPAQDPPAHLALAAPGRFRPAQAPAATGTATPLAATAATGAAAGIGLLALLFYPFFSRIDGHRILDNDLRSRVHEAIEHSPGITIKEIVQTLGIGWGTAVYHLKRLEAEHLIVSERNRQYRRYFKNGGGIANEQKGALAELKNPTAQRLANQILQRPGSAQNELCAAAGISAPLASKFLGRMENVRLLTRQREWKTVKYFPTARLVQLLGVATTPQPLLAEASA